MADGKWQGLSYAVAGGGFDGVEGFLVEAEVADGAGDAGAGLIHKVEGLFEVEEGFWSKAATGVGLEFCRDIGAFGPRPEFVLSFLLRVSLVEGEPAALETQIFSIEFGAAEAGDVGGELVKELPFDDGVGLSGKGSSEGGVLEGRPAGEFFGEGTGEGGVAEILFVLEAAGDFEGVLANEPVAEASATPVGKVLFGDWAAGEFGGEDGFDFREFVEPFDQGLASFAVAEATVKLFADFVGEAGDFALAQLGDVRLFHNFSFFG